MSTFQNYKNQFETYLRKEYKSSKPQSLYEPVNYILNIGGKRFRPVLILLTADTLGKISDQTLQAALGIEIFHNFTLLHDDIMDSARLRRGKLTVHEKYNTNTAILSGDVMLIQATQYITDLAEQTGMSDILNMYLNTAREICEGQQYDMDYEKSHIVSLAEYLEMIRLKTAVLLGLSMYIGARLSNKDREQALVLFDYGTEAGVAFQVWDDYLDVFGNRNTGKQTAGDIFNKKETYLIIQLRKKLNEDELEEFNLIWSGVVGEKDCERIIELMEKYKIDKETKAFSRDRLQQAIDQLENKLPHPDNYRPIISFTKSFITRDH